VGRPRWARILTITGASSIAAMIFKRPPQFGQCSMSMSKTRLSKRAQLIRAGACACLAACPMLSSAGLGTIAARSLASVWYRREHAVEANQMQARTRTSAARRCMTSSGDMTTWVVPSW
jgi:hypothetical protein